MLRISAIAVVALALASALGSPVAAQTVDPVAARSKAQDMISKSWGDVAFTASAWEKGPLVTHKRTGLVCRFNDDARNSVDVYEGEKFTKVGCTIGSGETMIYSYGDPPAGGVEQISMGAEALLKRQFTNVAPYTGGGDDAKVAGMPPTIVTRFTGERNGKRWYIRLTAMDMGRWSYIQRAIGPVEGAAEAERLGILSIADQARDAGYTAQASR